MLAENWGHIESEKNDVSEKACLLNFVDDLNLQFFPTPISVFDIKTLWQEQRESKWHA